MSRKNGKEISLSEKLLSLIQAKPSVIESDDEDITTVDKIATSDAEYSAEELDVPKFRKTNDGFLDEDDNKYSGKGISRKDIADFSGSDVDDNDESINGNEESGEEESDASVNEDLTGSESSGAELSDNDESEDVNEKIHKVDKKQDVNQQIFSKAVSDIDKGKHIKNQLHIWDFLLESRMKFQKCLLASNQFPSCKNFNAFKNKGGEDFEGSVNQTQKSLKRLLCSLLTFQDVLLNSNEEFTQSVTGKESASADGDEDEVESSSDNLNEDKEQDTELKSPQTSFSKLKKLSDFSEIINDKHKTFEKYRNSTINKWNDKTRVDYISNKNFSAFEQSTLKQIEHVLLDRQRLIKRTQTKRSNYHILGENEPPVKKSIKGDREEAQTASFDNKNKGVIHKEIFDDDDFYHQLLSELVKRKANDLTDPVQLGKQWTQLQKIRSKMKKTVDTRASKGRKVRFVVHPKLVNFMTQYNNSVYSEESRVELINSLFGKNRK